MPSTPGAFTTRIGGGPETMAAAMCKPVVGRWTATTAGPDGTFPGAVTAATGVMAALRKAPVAPRNRGDAAPTALATTKGAITATLNAGRRVARVTRWRRINVWQPRMRDQTTAVVNDLHAKVGSA
jgi:hypothetical protein